VRRACFVPRFLSFAERRRGPITRRGHGTHGGAGAAVARENDMHEVRRSAGALLLLGALAAPPHAARAAAAPATEAAAASAAAGPYPAATPRARPAPPWSDEVPGARATARLLVAGIALLAVRASRYRV
jgi:hypothetical protein